MSTPISPDDISEAKTTYMPDMVIDTWNRVIAAKFSSGSAKIMQNHIAQELVAALGIERQEVFDKGYLDIEDVYRAKGWKVEYDKPGYNESYEAYFVFSKKRK